MMAMPIRLIIVSAVPERKTCGSSEQEQRPRQIQTAARAPAADSRPSAAVARFVRWLAHVSRFPNRPVGLKIRTSTSSM